MGASFRPGTLGEIPERMRQTAMLRGLGYSYRQIAEPLQVTPQAVSLMLTRHRRSLKSLRDAMELHSLSARAVNVLGRHGICTREQARQANVLERLAGERNCGRKTMDEITRWMEVDGEQFLLSHEGSVFVGVKSFPGHAPSQPPTTHALSVQVIFTVVHQLAKRRLVGFVFLTIASMVDGQIDRFAHVADRERQCLPDCRRSADALGQLLAACFDLVLGTLPGHVVKRKATGIFVSEASDRGRNFGIPQSLSFLPRGMETRIDHHGLVETQLVRTLFADVEEYLHFVRHLTQFTRSSPDGSCTASLSKEDGWYYWYRLRLEDGPIICRHVHRFRATPEMLAQFHAGCSHVADQMERYLETWDDSYLETSDAFGNLLGDIGDSSDYDNWIDLVEDAGLLKQLHRVEGHNQDGDELAAWHELQRIPAEHEYHVEVLRRRLLYCHYADFVDPAALTRWARALVEVEPYNAINWTSLEYAVAGPDGEDHEAAAKVLREAVERHEPDFILFYGLASRLCSLNRLDEAREAMGLALKEDPYAITSALDSTCFAPIWEFLSEVQDSKP